RGPRERRPGPARGHRAHRRRGDACRARAGGAPGRARRARAARGRLAEAAPARAARPRRALGAAISGADLTTPSRMIASWRWTLAAVTRENSWRPLGVICMLTPQAVGFVASRPTLDPHEPVRARADGVGPEREELEPQGAERVLEVGRVVVGD